MNPGGSRRGASQSNIHIRGHIYTKSTYAYVRNWVTAVVATASTWEQFTGNTSSSAFAAVEPTACSTRRNWRRVVVTYVIAMSAVYRNSRLPRRHRPGSEWRWVRHYVPVMVKALILGLLAATMCGLASAAPAPQNAPEQHQFDAGTNQEQHSDIEDPVARSERSTNLSHITGTARKIQMYIKNRYLQILVDGIVNGTTDDTSAYSESPLRFTTLCMPAWSPRTYKRVFITPKCPMRNPWTPLIADT